MLILLRFFMSLEGIEAGADSPDHYKSEWMGTENPSRNGL